MIWNINFGHDYVKRSPFLFQQCLETYTQVQARISQFYTTKIMPARFHAKHALLFVEESSSKWLQEIP